MKVRNMKSSKGNSIPNQFILDGDNFIAFQSYNTIIVKQQNGKIYLDKDRWNYSVTTGKYRNLFLGENRKQTERKIKSGEYILTNLNT